MTERRPSDIPPATDELLAAGRRKVGEGRLNLRTLQPVGDPKNSVPWLMPNVPRANPNGMF